MLHKAFLPKAWSKDLAYICGLIAGDGSMPDTCSKRPNGKLQRRHLIYFLCESEKFCQKYQNIFEELFGIKPKINARSRDDRKIIYVCSIESIQIYNFLKEIGMCTGKKARIVSVPKMPKKYHSHFLAGVLDTDGGKKGSGFGLCTASKKLAHFCESCLKAYKIPFHSCPWTYNFHTYYQVYVHKRNMKKILTYVPLKHPEKIEFLRHGNFIP